MCHDPAGRQGNGVERTITLYRCANKGETEGERRARRQEGQMRTEKEGRVKSRGRATRRRQTKEENKAAKGSKRRQKA